MDLGQLLYIGSIAKSESNNQMHVFCRVSSKIVHYEVGLDETIECDESQDEALEHTTVQLFSNSGLTSQSQSSIRTIQRASLANRHSP